MLHYDNLYFYITGISTFLTLIYSWKLYIQGEDSNRKLISLYFKQKKIITHLNINPDLHSTSQNIIKHRCLYRQQTVILQFKILKILLSDNQLIGFVNCFSSILCFLLHSFLQQLLNFIGTHETLGYKGLCRKGLVGSSQDEHTLTENCFHCL